jgi:hypothetical protein
MLYLLQRLPTKRPVLIRFLFHHSYQLVIKLNPCLNLMQTTMLPWKLHYLITLTFNLKLTANHTLVTAKTKKRNRRLVLRIGTPDQRHTHHVHQFNIVCFRIHFSVEASRQETKDQITTTEGTKRMGQVLWESQHQWYYYLLLRCKRDDRCCWGVI